MGSHRAFIDTSGFFCLFNAEDACHVKMVEFVQNRDGRFVTTDWVVGETANLFKARKKSHLVKSLFDLVETSRAIQLVHVDALLFWKARDFMVKHHDQAFSFTDCVSFLAMKEAQLKEALTTDHHFRIAGFEPLLDR